MQTQTIRFNAGGANVRREMFDGREHLVVPVIAVQEQVLNGEFLPFSEIKKTLAAWEGVPIPLGHPVKLGKKVSANHRDVIERDVVGRFFNPRLDGNQLKGEMWVDIEKAQKTKDGKRAVEQFENGEVVEVSTAYFRSTIDQPGVHRGQSFNAVQANIIPDHLAILLHEKGACSVDDGCGAPRINEEETDEEDPVRMIENAKEKVTEAVNDFLEALAENAGLSHDTIRRSLIQAISNNERSDAEFRVVDVFDDYVVYERHLGEDTELIRRDYEVNEEDGNVSLGEPAEVRQEVSYPTVNEAEDQEEQEEEPQANDDCGCEDENRSTNKEQTMDQQERTATIQTLAENESVPFTEETLEGMEDSALQYLAEQAESASANGTGNEPSPEEEEEEEPQAQNAEAGGLDPEVVSALNEMGADGIRQVTNSAKELATQREQEKDKLVASLAENARCQIDKPTLQRMDLEALQGLQRSLGSSYYGRGGAGGGRVDNANEGGVAAPPPVVLAKSEDG